MREYGRIYTRFWNTPDITSLSDRGKLLAAYLLTSPHANMLGCFRLPLAYAAADLKWSPLKVETGLLELQAKGFCCYDPKRSWVVIHRYLKWNPVENPNQGKAAVKLLRTMPTDSKVYPCLLVALNDFAGPNFPFSKGLVKASETVLRTVTKPYRNQDQEQEQQQEPKKIAGAVETVEIVENSGEIQNREKPANEVGAESQNQSESQNQGGAGGSEEAEGKIQELPTDIDAAAGRRAWGEILRVCRPPHFNSSTYETCLKPAKPIGVSATTGALFVRFPRAALERLGEGYREALEGIADRMGLKSIRYLAA